MKITLSKLHRLFTPIGGSKYFLASVLTTVTVVLSFINSHAQVKPVPQQVPYVQDFGTSASLWVASNGNTLSATGILLLRASTGSANLSTAELTSYTTVRPSGSVRNYTTQGSNALFQPANNVLDLPNNVGIILGTDEDRTSSFNLALNTTGLQNIVVSYDIVTYETFAGYYLGAALQVSNTWNNSSLYTTIPATEYVMAGKGKGNVDNYTVTIPSSFDNKSEIFLRLIVWSNATAVGFNFPSVIVDNISVSGDAFTLTNLDLSVPSLPAKDVPFDVIVKSTNPNGAVGTVTSNTIITLSGIGTSGVLSGTLTTTILSGMSSATFSGLTYSQPSTVTLTSSVVLGDVLATDMGVFTVAALPLTAVAFRVKSVIPTSTSELIQGKAFSVIVESISQNGSTFAVASSTGFALNVSSGSGTLGGTLNGTILANASSATISGITYSKNEIFTLGVVSSSGQALASASFVLTILGDPLAGLTILYSEGFENFNKLPKLNNYNVSVVGLTSFNIDRAALNSGGSPTYGDAGFVVVRTSRGPWLGNQADNIGTTTFFDNTGSDVSDSNFVAAATSFFVSSATGANRYLVLPAITLNGTNLKLSWQAMSRGSFPFRDSYNVRYSLTAPSNPFDPTDFSELISTIPGVAQFINEPSRRVTNHTINLDSKFENEVIYIAFQLSTPAPGGDRLFFDNIVVSSGGSLTGINVFENTKPTLKAMPNPASETVLIQSTTIEDVKILNMIGNEVLVAKTNTPISITALTKGLYIAVTKKGTVKFIVE